MPRQHKAKLVHVNLTENELAYQKTPRDFKEPCISAKYSDAEEWHRKGIVHGYETVQVRRFLRVTRNGKKLFSKWFDVIRDKHNLLTDNGRDWMIAQVYTNTSAGTRGSGYIALTETAITPAPGNTVLTGEITTNGLARADATTKTHTAGTPTTIIEHTFTATGAFSTVQGSALFNASSGVTMSHINTFTSTALATNDQIKVTWTLSLG